MLDIVLQSINHGPRALGHLSYSAIVSRAVGILGYIRRALWERGSELIYYNKQSDVRPGGHCTGRWSSDYAQAFGMSYYLCSAFFDIVDQVFSEPPCPSLSQVMNCSLFPLERQPKETRKFTLVSSWGRRSEWGFILDRVHIAHVWVPRPIHCWCIGWLWFVREGVTGGSHRWEATQECEKIFLAQLRRWTYQFVVHPRNSSSLNLDQWNISKW